MKYWHMLLCVWTSKACKWKEDSLRRPHIYDPISTEMFRMDKSTEIEGRLQGGEDIMC